MDNIVPRYARRTYNHKIYWSHSSHKTADMYNSVVSLYDKPCVKRWLEFRGCDSSRYVYETWYRPLNIDANPERIWVLMHGKEPHTTFTSVVEAWFVLLGIYKFEEDFDWRIIYIDLKA
jgi:hypothetical protein